MATAQELAAQLKYGPQTGSAVRRSQYLADALKQMGASGAQNIRSPGELVAKLLATAILSKAGKSADREALQSLATDRDTESKGLVDALRPPVAPVTPAPPIAAPPAPAAPPQVAPQAAPALAQPQPAPIAAPEPQAPPQAAPMAFNASPEDRDALTRMLATEAIGEGAEGMAAAGHVALNRLKNGYGGAKSLRDVVFQPHQFEGMSRANQVSPDAYAKAGQVADAILSGQAPDPTGGAMAFLNPDLQVKMGRSIPKWAAGGGGHRIGNHVFFGGQPGAQPQQVAQAGTPATSTNGYQVPPPPPAPGPMAGGAGQDTIPPSAPVASPGPAAGTGPAVTPQATAGPTSAWPTWKPSDAEFERVKGLLADPRYHDKGVQEAMAMREKMTQPVPAKLVTMNGLSFYVPETPDPDTPPVAIPVPREAMSQTMSAQAAGLQGAPAGLNVQRDPLGNLKDAPGAPPPGYELGPNGVLQPQRNGPSDPRREQAPAANYRYTQEGRQEAVPGSAADPRNPMNVIEGTQRFAGQIKTIVDSAMKVKQNFGAVVTGFRQQNGPGDIAIINGIQKLIDEGVVKGEDVNVMMGSTGLSGTIEGWTQYLQSAGKFSPDVRTKIYKTAQDLYANLDKTYRVRVMSMKGPVEEAYGPGTFEKYVFPTAFADEMGWTGARPDPAPAPASGGDGRPTEAQRHAIQQYRGAKQAGGTEFNPSVVISQAQYDALKPGVWFIDDDGAKVQKKGGR